MESFAFAHVVSALLEAILTGLRVGSVLSYTTVDPSVDPK